MLCVYVRPSLRGAMDVELSPQGKRNGHSDAAISRAR
jgi:hypothetical protein